MASQMFASTSREYKYKHPSGSHGEDESFRRQKQSLEILIWDMYGVREVVRLNQIFFIIALLAMAYGLVFTEAGLFQKVFIGLGSSFVCLATMVSVNVIRNCSWSWLEDHRQEQLPGHVLVIGSPVWNVMSILAFLFATICTGVALSLMNVTNASYGENRIYLGFCCLNISSCTMMLCTQFRDRADAHIFSSQADPEAARGVPATVISASIRNLYTLYHYSKRLTIVFFLVTALLSVAGYYACLWLFPIETSFTWLAMAGVYWIVTTWALAMTIEHEASTADDQDDDDQDHRFIKWSVNVILATAAFAVGVGLMAYGMWRLKAYPGSLRTMIMAYFTVFYNVFNLSTYVNRGRNVEQYGM